MSTKQAENLATFSGNRPVSGKSGLGVVVLALVLAIVGGCVGSRSCGVSVAGGGDFAGVLAVDRSLSVGRDGGGTGPSRPGARIYPFEPATITSGTFLAGDAVFPSLKIFSENLRAALEFRAAGRCLPPPSQAGTWGAPYSCVQALSVSTSTTSRVPLLLVGRS